jgi:UDP-3-O-[3-hydroxymyristoyl] glucosamine N-acyltransferase
MALTLSEIAARIGGRVVGDGGVRIEGVAGIREAKEGEITFLANPKYEEFLAGTRASAIILHEAAPNPRLPALFTPEPYLAFLEVLKLFDRGIPERPEPGIHPTAVIAPSARLGEEIAVGPWVVVGEQAVIGDRTVLSAGVYVGPACRIGEECFFFPQVVVRKECEIGRRVTIHSGAVIGDDGFGFAPAGEEYRKIPQLGRVVIEDDVEIGANTTIARATTGETRIGRGSRLDNLVMVAHNVTIGANSVLCAQVGISGSTRVGRHVILAGQAGIVGHISIGDGARVGAQGGVTKSIPPGESVSGYPAQSHLRAQRGYAALRRLPDALRLLHEMEQKVAALEARIRELERG